MGMLIDGVWTTDGAVPRGEKGAFQRPESAARHWVRADGTTAFPAESGRYHLYVSLACPWAHRALVVRKLKKLEDAISVSIVDWHLTEEGWHFSDRDGATPDPHVGAKYLRDVYVASDPHFTGRVSVPVLWDKKAGLLVSNESAEIIRMLGREFDAFADTSVDLYPEDLQDEIDAINALVYEKINNGVYQCGFAGTQAAYEQAFDGLFGALDELEQRLSGQRYLAGDRMTEADWRLFTTLVRFDSVYFGHFKCNLRRIVDYPNLWSYLRELFQVPGIAETVNMHHIKSHYYFSHRMLNPLGIVPKGPTVDFTAPHDRAGVRARDPGPAPGGASKPA